MSSFPPKTFFPLCSKKSSELKAYLNAICHSSQLSGLRVAKSEMQLSSVLQGTSKKFQTCSGFNCVCYLTRKIPTVKQCIKAIICHPTQTFVSNHVTLQSLLFSLELSTLENIKFSISSPKCRKLHICRLRTPYFFFFIFSPTELPASGDNKAVPPSTLRVNNFFDVGKFSRRGNHFC